MPATPEAMLAAYLRALDAGHPDDVVPFYLLPCTFVRPDGLWVVQDEATALHLVLHLIDHARNQGWCRTETASVAFRALAPGLAELSGVLLRHGPPHAPVARAGFTYVLREQPEGWKIIVAVAHDAPVQAARPN